MLSFRRSFFFLHLITLLFEFCILSCRGIQQRTRVWLILWSLHSGWVSSLCCLNWLTFSIGFWGKSFWSYSANSVLYWKYFWYFNCYLKCTCSVVSVCKQVFILPTGVFFCPVLVDSLFVLLVCAQLRLQFVSFASETLNTCYSRAGIWQYWLNKD